MRKPRALRGGDRVAVVSPGWGGPAMFPHRYQAGKRVLTEQFGLEVVETRHALADPAWLARNPKARADDLMHAFADPRIKGIFASIGGNDAVRLIPFVDLEVIRTNPKVFVGYSDPTVIHFGCMKAGVGTLHGPTVMSGFAENAGMSDFSATSFWKAAFETATIGELPINAEGWTAEHLAWSDPANQDKPRRRTPANDLQRLQGQGRARGHLIGGCAEVMEMLKGTPWWPPLTYWDGAILFYETSEEAPRDGYVLRWMRNFAAQGILSRLAGMVLGRPGGHMDDAQRAAQKAAVVQALDEAGLSQLPVLADLDIGHTDPIATLPYGARAEVDCDRQTFRILDAGVV